MKLMSVNNLGNIFLVEDCDKISITDILREYKTKIKETLIRSKFNMLNENVIIAPTKTGNGGTRFWFICPRCKRRSGDLLQHPLQGILGCRICLGLEYKKRRFRGMIEGR